MAITAIGILKNFPINSALRTGTQTAHPLMIRSILFFLLVPMLGVAAQTPCTSSTPSCTEHLVLGGGAGYTLIYRSYPLDKKNEKITRAFVMVHGASYVVANPSSYAWPDSTRPRTSALPADVAALPPGYIAPISANPPAPFGRFGDSDDCTTYNDWPYGFKNRTGYTAKIPDDQLKKQLASRPTTYLVGELDILPLYGFDGSCPAMAQGPTRLARGLAFGRYVNEKFGAKHTTIVVPACGHNARCMFTADTALAVVFRKRD